MHLHVTQCLQAGCFNGGSCLALMPRPAACERCAVVMRLHDMQGTDHTHEVGKPIETIPNPTYTQDV